MASVPPRGIRSPMLLGGPHARAFAEAMAPFELDLVPYSETVGTASAVKMCRSVLIKGLEALVVESMMAARHYGVEREVLASLEGHAAPSRLAETGGLYDVARADPRPAPRRGNARGGKDGARMRASSRCCPRPPPNGRTGRRTRARAWMRPR